MLTSRWGMIWIVVLSLGPTASAGSSASEGDDADTPHQVFGMAEHLEYSYVAWTMLFIILFTIMCEKGLAALKRLLSYRNPLMMPCLDKVVSELMILGATAFLITVVNDIHNISDYDWYPTLHWIDTTMYVGSHGRRVQFLTRILPKKNFSPTTSFIFAILYIICALFYMAYLTYVIKELSQIDCISMEVLRGRDTAAPKSLSRRAHIETMRHLRASLQAHRAEHGKSHSGAALALAAEAVQPLLEIRSGGLDGYYGKAEEAVQVFLTSTQKDTTMTFTAKGYDTDFKSVERHVVALIDPLIKMKVVSSSVIKHGKDVVKVKIKKLPANGWHLSVGRVQQKLEDLTNFVLTLTAGNLSLQIMYHLVKAQFLYKYLPKADRKDFNFVLYLECAMTMGITNCFNITFVDWLCLWVMTLPVVRDIGAVRNYQIFSVLCGLCLLIALMVKQGIRLILQGILRDHYDIAETSLPALKAALTKAIENPAYKRHGSTDSDADKIKNTMSEQSFTSESDKFYNNLLTLGHNHYNPFGLALADIRQALAGPSGIQHLNRRPKKRRVAMFGIKLTDYRVTKFIQLTLLLNAMFLSIFFTTFLPMYVDGKCSLIWMLAPLFVLLVNLLVVTPYVMLLGFVVTDIVNANESAIHAVGRFAKEGASAFYQLKLCVATEFYHRTQEVPDRSFEEHVRSIYVKWAQLTPPYHTLSAEDLHLMMLRWFRTHQMLQFNLSRQVLYAMMSHLDRNMDGRVAFKEFSGFCKDTLAQMQHEEEEAPTLSHKLSFRTDDGAEEFANSRDATVKSKSAMKSIV